MTPDSPEKEILESAWKLSGDGLHGRAAEYLDSHDNSHRSHRYYASLAHFHYMITHYDEAESYARKSLKLNPGSCLALTTLGDISHRKGQMVRAMEYFKEAHTHHPEHIYTAKRLGSMHVENSEYDAALPVLERAREARSDDTDLLELLVLAYTGTGDPDQAAVIRRIITDLKGDDPDYHRIKLLRKIDQLEADDAIKQLKMILKLPSFPDKTEFHDKLGTLYIRQSRFSEAISHLESVLAARPRSDAVHIKLANCLVRSGRPEEGLKILEKLSHRSDDRKVITARIEALAACGSLQDAMDRCVRTLLEYPRDRRLRELLKILRKKGLTPTPGLLEENADTTP